MSEIPEIIEREQALSRMLAGQSSEATVEEAQAGLEAARRQRFDGVVSAPRSLGFGIIRAEEPVDGQRFLVAVTDGSRDAAISVTLTGTLVAILVARGEDSRQHVIGRLAGAVGSLPTTARRYEEILLRHQLEFTA